MCFSGHGMARQRTILDCYTDEPAGLGVPPFLGVWPRYAAGQYRDQPTYLTIDDLRLAHQKGTIRSETFDPPTGKTRIDLLNRTRSIDQIKEILAKTDQLTIIVGVQTSGKYLSAQPATLKELKKLLKPYKLRKILTGPVVACGTQPRGGSRAEIADEKDFDEQRLLSFDAYDQLQPMALKGATLVAQIPQQRIIEIETGRGCTRSPGCSFCTEPIKNPLQWRSPQDIIEEVRTLMDCGAAAFRLGKQSCIFSYSSENPNELKQLLRGLATCKPHVLHIDNANPAMVNERRTHLFVDYLTPGSTAALGVESFDPEVARLNNLNCRPEMAFEAIRTINRIGGWRAENGCHALLPGINILLGLNGESVRTLERNFLALKKLLDEGLLFRRINIRQVIPFPGTPLYEQVGNRFLKKNHKYYAGWIDKVRREIDLPMLQRLFAKGTILRDLYADVHEGRVTFLRQLGSYPIIVGVRARLPLGQRFNVRITDHMFRSLTGELV
jgi:radical SAM superfamily enzyme with C-terminal helix-hairpin-helix motif